MSLGVAVNCDNTEVIIGTFTEKLDEETLDELMQITQDVLNKYGKKEEDTDHNVYPEERNPVSMGGAAVGGLAMG